MVAAVNRAAQVGGAGVPVVTAASLAQADTTVGAAVCNGAGVAIVAVLADFRRMDATTSLVGANLQAVVSGAGVVIVTLGRGPGHACPGLADVPVGAGVGVVARDIRLIDVGALSAGRIAGVGGASVAVIAKWGGANAESPQALVKGGAELAVIAFPAVLGGLMGATVTRVAGVVGTVIKVVAVLEFTAAAFPRFRAEVANGTGIAVITRQRWLRDMDAGAVVVAAILSADVAIVALRVMAATGLRRDIILVPESVGTAAKVFWAFDDLAVGASCKETEKSHRSASCWSHDYAS